MTEVYIVGAVRTPQGRYGGALAGLSPRARVTAGASVGVGQGAALLVEAA
jgi:acetyl-CoA acetyltransferase